MRHPSDGWQCRWNHPTVNRYEFRQMSNIVWNCVDLFCSVVAELGWEKLLFFIIGATTIVAYSSLTMSLPSISSVCWKWKYDWIDTRATLRQPKYIKTYTVAIGRRICEKTKSWNTRAQINNVKKKPNRFETFLTFRWNDFKEMRIEKSLASPLPLNLPPKKKID